VKRTKGEDVAKWTLIDKRQAVLWQGACRHFTSATAFKLSPSAGSYSSACFSLTFLDFIPKNVSFMFNSESGDVLSERHCIVTVALHDEHVDYTIRLSCEVVDNIPIILQAA
jgi:hypothetical protein